MNYDTSLSKLFQYQLVAKNFDGTASFSAGKIWLLLGKTGEREKIDWGKRTIGFV